MSAKKLSSPQTWHFLRPLRSLRLLRGARGDTLRASASVLALVVDYVADKPTQSGRIFAAVRRAAERSQRFLILCKERVRERFGVLLCEACRWRPPLAGEWEGVLHVHHMVPLHDGGADNASNAALLCPNCHALAHKVWNTLVEISGGRHPARTLDRTILIGHLRLVRDDEPAWLAWRAGRMVTVERARKRESRDRQRASAKAQVAALNVSQMELAANG